MKTFVALAWATAVAAETRVVLEARRGTLPTGWKESGRVVEPSTLLELSFLLTTPTASVKRMEAALYARANPRSPLYGQWLSNDQVHSLAEPTEEAKAALKDFLAPYGG